MSKKKGKTPKLPKVVHIDGEWIYPVKKKMSRVRDLDSLTIHMKQSKSGSEGKHLIFEVTDGAEGQTGLLDLTLQADRVILANHKSENASTQEVQDICVGNVKPAVTDINHMQEEAETATQKGTTKDDVQKRVTEQENSIVYTYQGRNVLELYDTENNLLTAKEAENVCRALRMGKVTTLKRQVVGEEIEAQIIFDDKKYITHTNLYFNAKRDFICLYKAEYDPYIVMALYQVSAQKVKEFKKRFKCKVERATDAEVDAILVLDVAQYVIMKDANWNDLIEGEALYVANELRSGNIEYIYDIPTQDEFGTVQKLMLCGDKLCFICVSPEFDVKKSFCFECVDSMKEEKITGIIRN